MIGPPPQGGLPAGWTFRDGQLFNPDGIGSNDPTIVAAGLAAQAANALLH